MKHEDVWRAIDALAAENGRSISGLARLAGLDPTALNPSKRRGADGRARWPGLETLARLLEATGTTTAAFGALVDGHRPGTDVRRTLPLLGLARARAGGCLDAQGHAVGDAWGQLGLASLGDPAAYALEVTDGSLLPLYRPGELLVVSPAAPVRKGDRVLAATPGAALVLGTLEGRSARRVRLGGLGDAEGFGPGEVAWMHRVVWVSQ